MPRDAKPRYGFRALTPRDLKLVALWLRQPHLREWWGDPDEALAEIGEAIGDVATEPLIVELDGKPIGYLQSYDPHLEDDHPYADQPFGTLGARPQHRRAGTGRRRPRLGAIVAVRR